MDIYIYTLPHPTVELAELWRLENFRTSYTRALSHAFGSACRKWTDVRCQLMGGSIDIVWDVTWCDPMFFRLRSVFVLSTFPGLMVINLVIFVVKHAAILLLSHDGHGCLMVTIFHIWLVNLPYLAGGCCPSLVNHAEKNHVSICSTTV